MTADPRSYLSICTYCLQAVDIREPKVMRRVLAWMEAPGEAHGFNAALPVLLNEWAHQTCVIDRATERAKQMAAHRQSVTEAEYADRLVAERTKKPARPATDAELADRVLAMPSRRLK